MPRQEQVLTVFLASPGDVRPEREKVEEVVHDFNSLWSRPFRLRIELVRWETHAYPDVGADAQDVINNQIPDDYDIFLGIMWCRFGTPTGRAGSGTAEEFSRAWDRRRRDPSTVKLMFYFKDREPLPADADLAQIASVETFQRMLESDGVLHWTFTELNDFGRLVGIHLARQVQNSQAFKSLFPETTTGSEKVAEPDTDPQGPRYSRSDELDVYGTILSAHSQFMTHSTIAMQHNERINGVMHAFKMKGDAVVSEINSLTALMTSNPSAIDATTSALSGLLNKWETAMLGLAEGLDHELPEYAKASGTMIDAFIRTTAARIGLPLTERLKQMHGTCLQKIVEWRDVTGKLQDAAKMVAKTMTTTPDYTPGLAVAKLKVALALTRYVDLRSRQFVILQEGELMLRDLLEV